jgi:hypothetical protein
MAVKNIIADGFGFSPGSVRYILTMGFSVAVLAIPPPVVVGQTPQILLPKRAGLKAESAIRLKPSGRIYGPDVLLPKRSGMKHESAIRLKPGGKPEQHDHTHE